MRKTYKLIEEDTPKQEFKIINTSQNKKDVVFADGTSISSTYFSEGSLNGIDEVFKIKKINGITYYIAEDRTFNKEMLLSDQNGGKVFDCPLSSIEPIDKYFIVKKYNKNFTDRIRYALVDEDLKIVINWCYYIGITYGNMVIVTNEGENIFDLSSKKYLFKEDFDSIEHISSTELFKVEKDGEFNIVDKNGEYVFKTNSGIPIFVDRMESLELEFESDMISDKNQSLNCLVVTDSVGYDSLYVIKENVPVKVEIWYGDAILGEGSYKLLEDDPRSGALMITTKYEDRYTYINKDGKVQYDKWFSSYDKYTLEHIDCMIITRGKNFNIVSLKSMSPLCDDDNWFDDYEYINDPYGEDNDMLAVRKDGKCNLLDVTKNNYKDGILEPLLPKPCDDIMIYENKERKETHVFCIYNGICYLYISGNLIKCKDAYEGKNGIMFVRNADDKWNFLFTDHYNRKENPELELNEWADDIYDMDSDYPIIEKDGKYTFIDTESSEIAFTFYDLDFDRRTNKYIKKNVRIRWFEDVECYDETNYYPEFKVKEGGDWKTIDDIGHDLKEDEE